ncbi:Transmembrane protein 87B [Sesamum angolense]|uniref:Transmembrane protein 87B n=1 Tax=Sesamum angolense TaxID=2727404 RepID=A0AAE1X575_9LAMI|nr:Transmembrane protein 87B [Sesamum angolense]
MGFASSSSSQCCTVLKSCALLILVSAFLSTEASIHVYDRDPFREVGNAYLLSGGSEGIAANGHQGRSYIRFENITFWRSKEAADHQPTLVYNGGLVQVIIFEADDRDNIGGSAYGGQRSICCTSDLAKLEGCKQGEVIRTPSANDKNWPVVLNVYFRGNMLSTHMKKNKEINIKRTGIMSPLMKFYAFMSVGYAILCAVWVFQYVRYWNDVLLLQHCITSVIALGLLEMTFWYFDYAYFNGTGTRPVGITTWVVTIGAIRRTVSRILILSVAMGYGVVRPTLGGLTSKAKRSSIKLDIYRKFSNALAVTVIASVVWIGYEVYFKATDPFNERWQSAWIITAFWDIVAFALLCYLLPLGSIPKLPKMSNSFSRNSSTVYLGILGHILLPVNGGELHSLWLTYFHNSYSLIITPARYAYMDSKGEDGDDEETESLCRETPKKVKSEAYDIDSLQNSALFL